MLVFVYGTLRRQDCRAGVLDGYPVVDTEAYLDGYDMLHLGGFPGIVPGQTRIRGELYEIDEECLRRLDAIEGYREDDPEHSLYIRKKVEVEVSDGETFENVYTYVFNIERARGDRMFQVIESGDWFDVRNLSERSTS